MKSSDRNSKTVSTKKPSGDKLSGLVYVKLPEKEAPVRKVFETPDLNGPEQKAESKRRTRAINPTNETW